MARGKAHVGTSGWSYAHWRGDFYPAGLASRHWLRHYAETFGTVEVNNSFYRIPRASSVAAWCDQTPEGFRFSYKLWRGFTHYARLIGKREQLASYLDVVGHAPPDRRGVLLIHLHPQMKADAERVARLDAFLGDLSGLMGKPPWRVAVEFRNASWLTRGVYRMLDGHGASACVHDIRDGRTLEPNDASFVYVRRHGPLKYSAPYGERRLQHDARMVEGWLAQGRDVYVYYNNDVGGFAPRDASRLQEILDGTPRRPAHRARQVGRAVRSAVLRQMHR